MLKRAYYLLAVPWAALLLYMIFRPGEEPHAGPILLAVGPLVLPQILSAGIRFIKFGTFRRHRRVPGY